MIKLMNQPFDYQLGDLLIEKASSKKYNRYVIFSAFAGVNGVLRLKESMDDFRSNGGQLEAYIGIDNHITSYEALTNLLAITDELYIVHDYNPTSIYHSKIYYFSNSENEYWITVGSNNLTNGGLWKNFESALIIDNNSTPASESTQLITDIDALIDRYRSTETKYCHKVDNQDFIDKLITDGLIQKEIEQHITRSAAKKAAGSASSGSSKKSGIFGTYGTIKVPALKSKKKPRGEKIKHERISVTPILPVKPSDDSERMWFETRAMTGGSRNILDLSMLGKIQSGSAEDSRYETDTESIALGSIAFFDISPNDYSTIKDITINYKGIDYPNCTIKYPQDGKRPNGSWRIQLKGETSTGEKLTTAEEGEWLPHKILIFDKIRTDYYSMSVLPEETLTDLISTSIFVAHNGIGANSKRYGLL